MGPQISAVKVKELSYRIKLLEYPIGVGVSVLIFALVFKPDQSDR
tara:strand:+ start:609 stop:743 length:135 start_codon:yes stop_codon:yes gene_type:complete